MLFDDRKLDPSQLAEMHSCAIDTIEPYSLLLAPAYIYMKANNRVLSVKAPLDFFTPEELERVKRYGNVYFPQFVKSSVQFQTAARLIRKILTVQNQDLPRATFELMREVTHAVSELWFNDLRVEPFFAAVFAHELCDPMKSETILRAREEAVIRHDRGLLLSGMFVFIAVHLAWINLEEITACRDAIYERTVKGEDWIEPKSEMDSIVMDLNLLIEEKNEISLADLLSSDAEWTKQLTARLKEWSPKLTGRPERSPTIYGPEGFVA
ncbi:MAG: hypothetical protein JST80_01195 [Bdellovibrionales bacterium]|nr:hypothetical protein [Bdellovibrionales bacterium]